MSGGPTFPGWEHSRLVGSSAGDVATFPLLGAPNDRRALPLPTPMEKAWAFAFKTNVAITVALAIWTLATGTTSPKEAFYSLELGDTLHNAVYYGCLLVLLVALTNALSRWILRVLSMRCSGQGLKIGFGACTMASLMLANCVLSPKSCFYAIVAGVVWIGIAQAFIRHRQIEFAAATLKVAAMAVRSMPKVFLWSLCMAVVRLILLVTAGLVFSRSIADIPRVHGPDGTVYRAADCQTTFSTGVASCECHGHIISDEIGCSCSHRGQAMLLSCFWMASMGWSFAVCTSVMTATVARSVSLWWSSPRDVEPVWKSCQFVIHSSFGTLCKGSAANGFIELMTEGALRLASLSFGGLVCLTSSFPTGGGVVSSVVPSWLPTDSLVYLVQPVVVVVGFSLLLVKLLTNVVLGYTAAFAGIRRLSYSEGLDRAMELFGQVGATLVITEIVGGMGLLVAGVAPIMLYLHVALSESDGIVGRALGALSVAPVHASIGVFIVPMIEVLLCAYKAVIVCFLQDPEALAANHDRRLHDGLNRAWRNRYLSSSGLAQDTAVGRMTLFSLLELGYS